MATRLTKEQFIEKAKVIHGDKYNYSKVNYINSDTKVIIICPTHGSFEQLPCNYLRNNGCPKCSYEKLSINSLPTIEQFIEKAKSVHGNKYDYSKTKYLNSWTKLSISCKKHGEFTKFPNDHLIGQGCSKCSFEKVSFKYRTNTDVFLLKANKIHNNKYDYSKVKYINSHSKIIITCKKHGDFLQVPHSHLKGHGCSVCKSSKGELAIKAILDKNNIVSEPEFKFTEYPRLEYDFYLPELNILIEFHGIQHYEWIPYFHKTEEKFKEAQQRDIFKKSLAWDKQISMLEFNYKQLKHMTTEQFSELVINRLTKLSRKPAEA